MNRVSLLLLLTGASLFGGTQDILLKTFEEPATAVFAPDIPRPDQVLGMEIGSRLVRYDEVLRYMETLAEASPRAQLVEYGRTHEGRSLVILIVSDEANMNRLDKIKADTAAAASGETGVPDDLPVTFWLGHSIHGDETSGVDSSLISAYRLTAGEDAVTRAMRKNLVVLIDPIQNPDGRMRYIAQLTTYRNGQIHDDPQDLAHNGVWPWGRGNHYFFDLNRDAFALVHPETQGRTKAQLAWKPQVVIDAHEMGGDDTFLFTPSREPFNPHAPANIAPWSLRFGDDQAAAFDRHGWSYYTREWAEGFYPGYLDNWQNYRGAVSILYEQAQTSGLPRRKSNGVVATYEQAVARQSVSAAANLKTASDHREELLKDWADALAEARGKQGPAAAYLIPPGKHVDRFNRLANLLLEHGIRVERAASPFKARDAHGYWDDTAGEGQFPEGTLRVVLNQTANPVIQNLLTFHLAMDKSFLLSERASISKGNGSRLYDMTAWNLPMIYGLDAYWTESVPKGDWQPLKTVGKPQGQVIEGRARYGWLFDGVTDQAAALAGWLAQNKVKVRTSRKAFRFGDRQYAPGTFLIRGEENGADTAERLTEGAERYGVEILPVDSARIHEGNDMGGRTYRLLQAPRIALLAGMGISPSQYGAVWHMLDFELKLNVSALDINGLGFIDLEHYNVMIVPPTWGGLSKSFTGAVVDWVKRGGTLITIGNASNFLTGKDVGLTKAVPRANAVSGRPAPALGPGPATKEGYGLIGGETADEGAKAATVLGRAARAFVPKDYSIYTFPEVPQNLKGWIKPLLNGSSDAKQTEAQLNAADRHQRGFISAGSILHLKLDPDHWLNYGAGERLPLLFRGRDAWLANPGVEVAASFEDLENLHLSGLLWPEGAGRLARTAWLMREGHGKGQVIVFTADPVIRGFTLGTRRLLLNAVVLGPGLGARP
ncbi:MAG: M14 family zinc carboxypeptidase [Acidobacteriota bacterium]|nr:M14 family zinc carboxypeptidase [Acidobacteriota bacterium]